ncbi:hypothetical protein COL32_29220 [Bacillus pseudomycoides]|nr:hypothetical protein COL29_12170 [Bacillus pseudomycoides]PFX36082.1 hypothetical protein COL32_29220 [Bacillus pseudomycoides]
MERVCLLFFLNFFQVVFFFEADLEKTLRPHREATAWNLAIVSPLYIFFAYKSRLAGGVGGERCYQSVSQRFVLAYQTVHKPE